jgi:hypothetical protein
MRNLWTLQDYERVVAEMEDLNSKLEKLFIEAEDCALIGRLATDPNKRELFKKLAFDLRSMAEDIKIVTAGRAKASQ